MTPLAIAKRTNNFNACSGFFTSVNYPQVFTTPATKNKTSNAKPKQDHTNSSNKTKDKIRKIIHNVDIINNPSSLDDFLPWSEQTKSEFEKGN